MGIKTKIQMGNKTPDLKKEKKCPYCNGKVIRHTCINCGAKEWLKK